MDHPIPPQITSDFVLKKSMDSCDEMMEFVTGGDGEFIQIGSGTSQGAITRIDLEGANLFHLEVSNRTLAHAVTLPGFSAISVPLRWKGTLGWNAFELDAPQISLWTRRAELTRVGQDVSLATLFIKEKLFEDQAFRWAKDSVEQWEKLHGVPLPLSPETTALSLAIESVLETATTHPAFFKRRSTRLNVRDSLLAAAFEAIESVSMLKEEIASMQARTKSSLVKRATDYIQEMYRHPISLQDICLETSANARSVEYAFREILDLSPIQYLRILRLHHARTQLREHSIESTTVSECATGVGFSHLGRFSIAYRKQFGESPSDTLKRSGK